MHFLKRVVPLILAILMVLGTLSVAFQTAFAAEFVPELGSGHKGVNGSTGFTVKITGAPDPDVYDEAGTYTFKITGGAGTVQLNTPSDASSSFGTISVTGKDTHKFTYGNLTLEKTGSALVDNDEIRVVIAPRTLDTTKDAFISSSKISRAGQNLDSAAAATSISRNTDADVRFIIVDPNFPANITGVDGMSYVLNTDSFTEVEPTSSRKDTEIRRIEGGVGGKLAFQFDLRNLRYSGKGNTVKFNFSYTIDGQSFEYSLSQNFPECRETDFNPPKDNTDDEDEKPLDPLVPHIIVSDYSYGNRQVSAGQSFELNLTFTNTSNSYTLSNVVMKVAEGEGFTITNSSNSFYLSDLEVGQSINKTLSLQALPSAKAQSYPVKIDFTFQYIANDTRKEGSSSESISIPISQPDRFSVNEVQVPQTLMVGEEYPLSATFVNKGKAEINNVTAELRGNIQNSGERQFVGNVASGTESSADFYISAMEEGTLEGEIVITYEDSNMNIKEVRKPFVIQVQSMGDMGGEFDPGMMDPVGPVEPEETNFWTGKNILLGLAAILVAGLSCAFTILKLKAKRGDMFDETI